MANIDKDCIEAWLECANDIGKLNWRLSEVEPNEFGIEFAIEKNMDMPDYGLEVSAPRIEQVTSGSYDEIYNFLRGLVAGLQIGIGQESTALSLLKITAKTND